MPMETGCFHGGKVGAPVPLEPSQPHRLQKKKGPMKVKRPFDREMRRAMETAIRLKKA